MAVSTVAIIGTAGRRADAQRLSFAHFTSMVSTARAIIRQVLQLSPSQVHLVSGGSSYADHVAVVLYLESVLGQAETTADAVSETFAGLTLHLPAPFHGSPTSSHLSPSPSSSASQRPTCGCASSVSHSHPHFLDNGASSWKTNPGRLLNRYHSQFSAVMNRPAAPATQCGVAVVPSSPFASTLSSSSLPRPPFLAPPLFAVSPSPRPPQFSSFHDLHTALALGADLCVVDDPGAAVVGGRSFGQHRVVGDAMHRRNSLVAQCQQLIAFTFGGSLFFSSPSSSSSSSLFALLSSPSNQPCAGGTADTWSKCRGTKIHIPLDHLFSPRLTRCLQSPASFPPPTSCSLAVSASAISPAEPRAPTLSSLAWLSTASLSSSSSTSSTAGTQRRRRVRERPAGGVEDGLIALPRKRLLTSWLQRGVDDNVSPTVC